jgi:hypothetical protein
MINQLSRLLRLRVLREERSKRRYEKLVLLVELCATKRDACQERRTFAAQKLGEILKDFQLLVSTGEVCAADFISVSKQRDYFEKLDLYYEAELIQAEYEHLEASDKCEYARSGYLNALRERERIEQVVEKMLKTAAAESAAKTEEEAAETWSPR